MKSKLRAVSVAATIIVSLAMPMAIAGPGNDTVLPAVPVAAPKWHAQR